MGCGFLFYFLFFNQWWWLVEVGVGVGVGSKEEMVAVVWVRGERDGKEDRERGESKNNIYIYIFK